MQQEYNVPHLIILKTNETPDSLRGFCEYIIKQVFCVHFCSGICAFNAVS